MTDLFSPDTIMKWYRQLIAKKYDGSANRKGGRPKVSQEIIETVLRMKQPDSLAASGTADDIPIRLTDVPKLPWVPRGSSGRRIALAVLYRWCAKGMRGHRLRYMRIGHLWYTTPRWLQEFFYRADRSSRVPHPQDPMPGPAKE